METWPAEAVPALAVAPPGVGVAWVLDALRWAERDGLRVRAAGSGWSFSRAALGDGLMLDLRAMSGVEMVADPHLGPGREAGSLALVGPGATLSAVCACVEARGRSLPVTNGRGGLTLVGALATGSHGSAVDLPPIGDFLAGMAIAVTSDRVVWVEGRRPALSDDVLRARGWERVADDSLLAAAQVHLGCWGVVVAVAMELWPAFDLDHRWQRVPVDERLRALLQAPSSRTVPGSPDEPLYHANLVLNPHTGGLARLSAGWRAPALSPPSVDRPPRGVVPGFGAVLTPIPRSCPGAVGPILDLLIGGATRPPRQRGRLGTIFPARVPRGYRPISMEVAVDTSRAGEAFDALVRLLRDRPDGFAHPGFLAIRWMRGTRALLGFTRFEHTITFEIPTLTTPGVERTFARVRDLLEPLGGVEHPGQHNHLDPVRLRAAFGSGLTAWRAAREALLGPAAWRFTSPWSEAVGLT